MPPYTIFQGPPGKNSLQAPPDYQPSLYRGAEGCRGKGLRGPFRGDVGRPGSGEGNFRRDFLNEDYREEALLRGIPDCLDGLTKVCRQG